MSKHQNKVTPEDSVSSLQEQVRLLSLENETMRNILTDKGLNDVLKERLENRQQNDDKTAKPRRPRYRSTSLAKQKSPNLPSTPGGSGSKGCACKGNCSNRICGCVKKNLACTELCKCRDVCQNMNTDKENIDERNDEIPNSQSITENKKKVKNKKKPVAELKNRKNRIVSEDNDENKGEKSQESEPSESETEVKINKKKKVENKKKPVSELKNRKNRIDSKDNDEHESERSQESEHSESESETKINNKKIVDYKKKSVAAPKNRKNRTVSEDNDKHESEKSQESEQSESESEVETNKKKKVGNKKKPVSVVKNRRNRIISSDSDEREAKKSEKSDKSKSENDNKKQMKAKQNKDDGVTYRNKKRLFSEDEETVTQHSDNINSEPGPSNKNNKKPVKQAAVTSGNGNNNIQEKLSNDDQPSEQTRYSEFDTEIKFELTTSATSSNSSGETDYVFSPENLLEISADFNPMKPRRQLPRSPIGQHPDLPSKLRIRHPSEILLPIPIKQEEENPEEEVPLPAELEKDVVDWNEHTEALVACKKCKRKFYRYRIKKHEASCQQI